MKIRTGFITNSSSTSFLIISKKELTSEYLFKKLGFVQGGKLEQKGWELCNEIIRGAEDGLRYYDIDSITYDRVLEEFGPKAAERFNKMIGSFVYWGYTSSDESIFTQFFTTDSFEIEKRDFYLNGRSCVW